MDQTEAELERFRQQWRDEVSAKTKPQESKPDRRKSYQASASSSAIPKKTQPPAPKGHYPRESRDETEASTPFSYHDLEEKETGRKAGFLSYGTGATPGPATALEHYERAVEREGQGSLGDSVALYRKAFRIDPNVQDLFKKKHFPQASVPTSTSKSKSQNPNPSNAPVTVPNTAHHSLTALPPTVSELIADFAQLSIPGEPAPTDFSPAPPCPIAEVPDEILTQILMNLAVLDVASFTRMSQVCKRLAYLVLTEDSIWKRVIHGTEFGLEGMHYKYACTVEGQPISINALNENNTDFSLLDTAELISLPSEPSILQTLDLTQTYPTYRTMFRLRPRLRFSGCYISTVNYTRPGQTNSLSWNTPILIVTYYRYIRFYRDGTCISLLTTSEPADVVPFLSKEYLGRETTGLPHGVMRDAVGGRWRLGGDPFHPSSYSNPPVTAPVNPLLPHPAKTHDDAADLPEGHVHIETPGVVPKYMYKMHFNLASTGKSGARNNKLQWVGYWSWNRLTDDWAEFELKNDKAFYWSRVKSWANV